MSGPRVLVLNAGSSSLKASLVELPDTTVARRELDWGADASRTPERLSAVRAALGGLVPGSGEASERSAGGAPMATAPTALLAVGHRVVHGGSRFTRPTLLDDAVVEALREVSALAPLHNGVALEAIAAARESLPDVPHVACFDTAYHADLPEEARRYPLPDAWHLRWGVRRYGFHGLSVSWAVGRAATLLGRGERELGLVVAHLGSGCSVTAVDGGRSVDTSMGLTPLEGLMMGTRSGSVDPGILVRLLEEERLTLAELADALDHRSGLLGVSGIGSDVRALDAAAAEGDARARLALSMFARRAAAGIAAAATALRRLDAVVFTGGIGEHAVGVRADIVMRLAPLGLAPLPPSADGSADGSADAVLSSADARVAVLRVRAREDVVIAREAAAVLRS